MVLTEKTMEGFVLLVVLGVAAIGVYFLPVIIASKRGHHQTNAIGALNTFLGWTFIGWVVAFVWAVSAIRRDMR
jgi:uncharacterized membrane protein YGL010W